MNDCIGGVILFDETIKQTSNFGKTIPDLITTTGAVPGIKVDTGAKILANSPEEKITEGLDGLRDRLKKYYELGARFTKWRGVYSITEKYQVDYQFIVTHMHLQDTLLWCRKMEWFP